jgi:hypothetical protein
MGDVPHPKEGSVRARPQILYGANAALDQYKQNEFP